MNLKKMSKGLAAGLLAWCGLGAAADAQDPFSIVLIPDPQNYSEKSSYGTYGHQTQWMVDNRSARNIQFVVHLGDITNHDVAAEYTVASAAHTILDNAGMPYSMTNGNHELFPSADAYKRDSLYKNYFGSNRYTGKSFYGGSYNQDNETNFTLFEVGALKFMVVSLEFAPRKDMVSWANSVIQAHPDRRVIVATHCYLNNDGEYAPDCADHYNLEGREPVDLWEELVSRHSNIFLAVSGHIQGVAYRQRTGNNGNIVHEVLNDFQDEPVKGTGGTALGNGWLRVLTFNPAQNSIGFESLTVENGNFAIFNNGTAQFYLPYNQVASPTPTKHNLHSYSVSYNMQTPPTYAYKINDYLFHDRMAGTALTGVKVDPRIAAAPNGDFVTVWRDDSDGNGAGQIHARGFDKDGNPRFGEITVNSVAGGEQRKPDVAMDDNGNFVVVWEDDQDGNGSYQILARGFNANGTQKFADKTVNTVDDGQQYEPAIGMDSAGNFVVAWEDDQDANGSFQILARGFTATGAQRFADFTVNTVAAGQQFNPAVALDNSGDFVVGWEDDQDNNNLFQIFARGFTATGAQRFAQLQVNTNAGGNHAKPQVAMDANGAFAVVWEDDQDNNGYYQIYARGFTLTGTQRFGVTTVNSVGGGQQYAPTIAMKSTGDFVVGWEDDQDDNGAFQILGRGFTSAGAQKKADFTVNSDSSGQQYVPAAAIDEQSRFVMAWQDDMDGDGNPIILVRNLGF
ncbi:MAG: metallophosphoesterase [Myxococcales bacterium]